MSNLDTEIRKYLLVVDYEADAERKRAEYLLDNWEGGNIEKIQGMTRLASGVDIEELYDDLAAKIPEQRISTYEVNEISTKATRTELSISHSFEETNPERVEWAMETILNKRKAVKQGSRDGTEIWGVYSKKGRAEISYHIISKNRQVELQISIEGFGDAAEFLKKFIQEELQYMID